MSNLSDKIDKHIKDNGLLNLALTYEIPYDIVVLDYDQRKKRILSAFPSQYKGRESHLIYNTYQGTKRECQKTFLASFE